MIAVEQLKKSFGPNPVLRGVSMNQQKGETIVIKQYDQPVVQMVPVTLSSIKSSK